MNGSKYLFFLMNHVFYGFGYSIAYGLLTALVVWIADCHQRLSIISLSSESFCRSVKTIEYVESFFKDFNGALSGGLIFSTAILVFKTQKEIPDLIDKIFTHNELKQTEYFEQRRRYLSARRSTEFSSIFIVIGFILFYFAKFPFEGMPLYFLIAFSCIQYALGVYIGRKLFYIAQMLKAIESINIDKDIFTGDKLGFISNYVNSLSTLTIIFVFVHVSTYYNAPFEYVEGLEGSLRIALLLPALLAIPVVAIFNFYPRTVLRTLYEKSIEYKTNEIRRRLINKDSEELERLSYLVEYDKMSKSELNYRARVTLRDIPVVITIILTVVGLLVKNS